MCIIMNINTHGRALCIWMTININVTKVITTNCNSLVINFAAWYQGLVDSSYHPSKSFEPCYSYCCSYNVMNKKAIE